MFGRTNAGGGISPFAFIFATYPVGFVCTCTDGSRTLKLKDTSGSGVFYPPYAGTWTVTATDPADPTNTASETVEITKEGEAVSVELSYALWLYKDGDECTNITGGWLEYIWENWAASTGFTATKTSGSLNLKKIAGAVGTGTNSWPFVGYITNNAIDFTGHDYLVVYYTLTGTLSTDSHATFGVMPTSNSDHTDYMAAVDLALEENELLLPVSGLSSGYVEFNIRDAKGASSEYELDITRIGLKK